MWHPIATAGRVRCSPQTLLGWATVAAGCLRDGDGAVLWRSRLPVISYAESEIPHDSPRGGLSNVGAVHVATTEESWSRVVGAYAEQYRLSRRERSLLLQAVSGASDKLIAYNWACSRATV